MAKGKYEGWKFAGVVVGGSAAIAGLIALEATFDTQVTPLQPPLGIIDVHDKYHATINRCLVPDPQHPENVYRMELNANHTNDPGGRMGVLVSKLSHGESDDGFGPMRYSTRPVQKAGADLGRIVTKVHSGAMIMLQDTFRNEDDSIEVDCAVEVTTKTAIPDSFDGNVVEVGADPKNFKRLADMHGPITYDTKFVPDGQDIDSSFTTGGQPLQHIEFK